MNIDKLVILNAGNYSLIYNQLVYGFGFEKQMVTSANFLLNVNVLQKYEKESDAEIQHSISSIKTKNEFDVFCGYCPKPREKYIVEWDEKYDMPYVIFEGKRIYYPRNKQFSIVDGHQCVMGLEYEQQLGSPHTYITEHHNINDGDVVIDAGVCEGNFAIKYIDRISKLYLIECNPNWIYPLQLTFKDYLEKIVICQKFLSDKNDERNITIDELVNGEKVDFIKMDIEGAEVSALKGAKYTFENNNIKCSICAYHRHGDEENIRNILDSYGYSSSVSRGHMLFHCDPERFKWSELRHGIIYGRREI